MVGWVDRNQVRGENLAMDQSASQRDSKLIRDPVTCRVYGAFVRGARMTLGLNQRQFAVLLGVTRSTLVRLEQGGAPMRTKLCEASFQLLAELGAKADNLQQFGAQENKPEELVMSFKRSSMETIHDLLEQGLTAPEDLKVELFTQNYVAPLKRQPLRKSK